MPVAKRTALVTRASVDLDFPAEESAKQLRKVPGEQMTSRFLTSIWLRPYLRKYAHMSVYTLK